MKADQEPYTLYLDESGNTGRRYLDPDQPIFVLGGWIFKTSLKGRLESIVSDWELAQGKTHEIKAKTLLKTRSGREKTNDLLRALRANGAVPIFAIQEKKFGFCSILFEAFFGTRIGESGYEKYISDASKRIWAANHLFNTLNLALLLSFEKSIIEKNEESLVQHSEGLLKLIGASPDHSREPSLVSSFLFSGNNAENSINASVFQSALNVTL
ncbi:MAG: DUF3800 domain-containing protein [Bdellovibrionales bacterium]|nr:DUF3800 domain-containing protein [Bdellovibrionales bacterium]